ncbi:MAG: cyclic nucleotide-binding domain-containing protein [Gemmataceae bacterium]
MNHPQTSDGHRSPNGTKPQTLNSFQLALISQQVLDIPQRIRALLLTAGLAGIVIIIVESLVSGDEQSSIPIDKMLHFGGYATLALIFTLSLRPILYVPMLVGLGLMGLAIEFIQPSFGRTYDLYDAVANGVGLVVGAMVGLLLRIGYANLRTEISLMDVRSRLLRFEPGEIMMRQGELIDQVYIIKEGQVQLSREVDGEVVPLTVAGPGDVLGILAVVQGTAQFVTATPITRTTIYGMSLEQLLESAGGNEVPVASVLRNLTEKLREASEKITRFEIDQRRGDQALNPVSNPGGVE